MPNAKSLEHPVAPTPAEKSRSTDPARRRFLFTLGAGSAGALAATAGVLPATATAEVAVVANDQDSPYRETEHVRDYYRTTRI
ncbi:MAG: hypothetical protein ABI724_08600 [Betaproteobacteria bacterium]